MVTKISLTRGEYALIDNIDSDLEMFRWQCLVMGKRFIKKYARRSFRNGAEVNHVTMHTVILERALERKLLPKETVDHINGNGLDNRRCNLRSATKQQNGANRRNTINATGYKGVTKLKPYQAGITTNGRRITIGYFDTAEEAARAYDKAARELFGEFAALNFPDE